MCEPSSAPSKLKASLRKSATFIQITPIQHRGFPHHNSLVILSDCSREAGNQHLNRIRTQKPLLSLWKVTRSMTPEISSVAGLRSRIAAFMCGDSFCHGRLWLVTHYEPD